MAAAQEPALHGVIGAAEAAALAAVEWLQAAGEKGAPYVEAGARRFGLGLGRALALALLCRHAAWAIEQGDRRPLAAALRFAAAGLPEPGSGDLDLAASLAMDA